MKKTLMVLVAALFLGSTTGLVFAQTPSGATKTTKTSKAHKGGKHKGKKGKKSSSTGATTAPASK